MKGKRIRFVLGFGLCILIINAMTSFGSWWFQFPTLSVALISYLAWLKNCSATSQRITALRENICIEAIGLIENQSDPTDKELAVINRRIKLSVRFYRSLYFYLGVNGFLLLINLMTTPLSWWFQYPLVVWGFFLYLHWTRAKKHLPKAMKQVI